MALVVKFKTDTSCFKFLIKSLPHDLIQDTAFNEMIVCISLCVPA